MSEKSATTYTLLHLRFKLRVPPDVFLAKSRRAASVIANPNCELLNPDLSTTASGEPERLRGVTPSPSNIILGEHLSGALIQLLRATYFFKARQQIVRS